MLILLLSLVFLRVFLLVGLWIWLWRSLGVAGLTPDATCRFSREEGTGSRRNFFVGCPNVLAASDACFVTDRWFTLIFQYSLAFVLMLGWLMLLARLFVNLSGLLVGLILLRRSSSSSSRVVQDVWDVYRDELEVVLDDVVLALRDAASRSAVDDCLVYLESESAEAGLCSVLTLLPVAPLPLAALPFLVEVGYVFVAGV